jgi:amino acid adenylation domain-containing protein
MDPLSERLARLSPEQLAQLMQRAREKSAASVPVASIPRQDGAGPWPLSFAQQRLWFVQQLDPRNVAYNMVAATRLEGALNVETLQRALDVVVERHEALRTVFVPRDGDPAQQVVKGMRAVLATEDLSGVDPVEWDAGVERRVRREQERPFDLEAGPPLRATLLRLVPERHVLILVMHHVAGDGWSRGVIVRELSAAYTALAAGEEARLPPVPVRYTDYAVWQRERMRGNLLDAQLGYWTGKLAGAPPTLPLPTDRPRPPVQSFAGASHRFRLPGTVVESLCSLGREEEATLFMVLMAGFKTLLARYSGQPDQVVGTPIANRGRSETEGVVGFFANTLALRTDLSGDPTFREALRRVRETALGAYAHEELPFERLVEELHQERSLSRSQVFQVMLLLDESPLRPFCLPGLELEPVEVDSGIAMFDLTLQLERADDGLAGRLEYATALFDAATAGRMAEHLGVLLRGVAAAPDARLSELPLVPAAERALLERWSESIRDYPAGSLVHELFAAQAARTPDAPALVHRGAGLTYSELDTRANRLANHLRGLGVGPESRVGVSLERTPELIVALLGVLKAGGAYVPLDPAYPRERLGATIADAGIRLVLTAGARADRLPAGAAEPLPLDALAKRIAAEPAGAPASGVCPENLSHVIFTSGSTGRPKGVMIRHSSTAALLHWMRENVADEERASVLASTSVSFDVSVAEIFGTICWGGKLVLVENALDLPAVGDQGIRYASMVPTAAAELLRSGGIPESVRTMNLAGEALPADLARALYDLGTVGKVRNLYGPTEDTSYSTCSVVEPGADRVLIGRPLANTRAYVLDDALCPAPLGVGGELYLAGAGLSRGYEGRPEWTAASFLPDPFGAAGARMYRTHDRARWTAAGELEYLGRSDFQVKVRGFRIEPGEIETALRAHPAVRDAVAVVREEEPGTRRLVAYVVTGEGAAAPPAGELRAHLKERLPEYMVPSAFVALEALPLTSSSKVDRKALPAPDVSPDAGGYVVPATPTEELLAGIFAEVLGAERAGARDDFFALGGHSLLATRVVTRVRGAFGVDLPVRALFEAPTVAELAPRVEALRRTGAPAASDPLVPVPRDPLRALPLSFAQRRLWLLDRMEPGSAAYNVPFALQLRGTLDVPVLERALGEIVRRHEALRTTFATEGGEPVQVVRPTAEARIPVTDLRRLPAERREGEVRRLTVEESLRPFDLARGPLLRATLLLPGEEGHVLLFTLHHIVSDGWSMEVLVREVSTLYEAFARGSDSPLPALPVQYADYAVWQRARLNGPVLDGQLAYWRERLAGAPASLDLPTDRPRPPAPTNRGASVPFVVGAETTRALRALSRGEGATLFMTLLAGFQALLSRHSGETDVSVGTPVAGRNPVETEGLVGFFVNTLVLRTDLSDRPSFTGLLARVREATLGAFAHQDLPFERLVEELAPERSPLHTPLFQALFTLQNHRHGVLRLGGAELEEVGVPTETARFDLTLGMREDADSLVGQATYRTEIFDRATIERMLAHYVRLLGLAVADGGRPVHEHDLLSGGERRQVLEEWNDTATAYSAGSCIHQLFAARAEHTPDAPALLFEDRELSYAELDRRSSRLAHHLRRRGVAPERRVALYLNPSPEAIIALLAVLKAGGAYVPLDPASPAERLAYVLEDSGAELVVTDGEMEEFLPPGAPPVVRVDGDAHAGEPTHAFKSGVGPDNLAYVIYTSGSTGRPKGVLVQHGGVINSIEAFIRVLRITEDARVLLFAPLHFDSSVLDVFTALCAGAELVVASREDLAPGAPLIELLRRQRVTHAKFTPSALAATPHAEVPDLRTVITGGETCSADVVARWAPGRRFLNGYGPTETSVRVTAVECRDGLRPPSIGRAVENVRLYVLDEALQPVPIGVRGELFIGGVGLARGYRGRSDLTAEKFVPDPFSGVSGARLYRSGDRVRWLVDGTLEFVGRTDEQIKIRGVRIEPGEIRATLLGHPALSEAFVAAPEDARGERRLVAYVVPSEGDVTAAELRSYLKGHLPDAMVPSVFVVMEALPLNSNGKVDRRALPVPAGQEDEGGYAAPRTPLEEILAGIFAGVLGVDRVGARDDFFALGGHSLLATQVATHVRAVFGTELPLRVFFRESTVAGLAAWLDAHRAGPGREPGPIERIAEPGVWLPLSFAQQRLWLVHQMNTESRVYNQGLGFRLHGRLDAEALRRALTGLVQRHAVFRTRFVARSGVPGQVIDSFREVPLPLLDLSGLPDREALLHEIVRWQARQLFDLGSGVLLRAVLVRLSVGEHALVMAMHHITNDGWSSGIIFREVSELYRAFSEGGEPALPEPPIQYADYAVWQRKWLTPEREREQLDFWRRQLDALPTMHLAGDRSHAGSGTDGETQTFFLSPELSEGVRGLSRSLGTTPFMTLLAAFQVLLRWQGRGDEVVVGTDIANRNVRSETEGLIGFFVNQLVLRTRVDGALEFAELAARVREVTLAAYDHQDVPFDRVVEALRPKRVAGETPFFRIKFVLQNASAVGAAELPGLVLEPLEVERGAAQLDVLLAMQDRGERISGWFEYRTSLFSRDLIGRWIRRFQTVLEAAVEDPGRKLDELAGRLQAEESREGQTARDALKRKRLARFAR